jgi:hypothetical protein
MRTTFTAAFMAAVLALPAAAQQAEKPKERPWPPVATFSILAFDPATGEVGGAVQSRVFSVGNGVLWASAGHGAVATQAIVDVSYGPQAIELLEQGMAPEAIVRQIWDGDPDPRPDDWTKQGRQFAVIDTKGNVHAFTGPRASSWAGHTYCTREGSVCSAQGRRFSCALPAAICGPAASRTARPPSAASAILISSARTGGAAANSPSRKRWPRPSRAPGPRGRRGRPAASPMSWAPAASRSCNSMRR